VDAAGQTIGWVRDAFGRETGQRPGPQLQQKNKAFQLAFASLRILRLFLDDGRSSKITSKIPRGKGRERFILWKSPEVVLDVQSERGKKICDQWMLPPCRTTQNTHSIADKFRSCEVSIDRWHFSSLVQAQSIVIPASPAHEISLASGVWPLTSQKRIDYSSREKKRHSRSPVPSLSAMGGVQYLHSAWGCRLAVPRSWGILYRNRRLIYPSSKTEICCWQQFAKGKHVYCASFQLRLRVPDAGFVSLFIEFMPY
jgi:hypothetical protein